MKRGGGGVEHLKHEHRKCGRVQNPRSTKLPGHLAPYTGSYWTGTKTGLGLGVFDVV